MQVEDARAAARAPVLGAVARVLARRAPSQQADLRASCARDAARRLDNEGNKVRVVRPTRVLAGARLDEALARVVLEGPVCAPAALPAPLHEEGVVLLGRPKAVEVADRGGGNYQYQY